MAWYAAGALSITVLGIIVANALSVPGFLIGLDTAAGFAVSIVLSEIGFVVAAVVFVLVTGRGTRYFDLDPPDSWVFVAAVTLALYVFRTAVLAAAVALGVDPSPPAITGVDLPIETLIMIMIPVSVLVIGPAEELLFRGAIQKYLGERVSPNAAVVGAGTLFGLIHIPALIVSTGAGALVSLGTIFTVGLALGWLYERTGTVVSAMAAHAGYNALIFGTGYIASQLILGG